MEKLHYYLRKTLLIGLFLFFQTAFLMAVTTIPVGSGQTYTTIQAAYNSGIPADITGLGAYEIVLQSTYVPSSETYPITLGAKTGASAVNTITIKPASGVSKTIAASIIANTTTTTAAASSTTSFTGSISTLAAGYKIAGLGVNTTVSTVGSDGIVTLVGAINLTAGGASFTNASWIATNSSGTITSYANTTTTTSSKIIKMTTVVAAQALSVGMLVGGRGILPGTTVTSVTDAANKNITISTTPTYAATNVTTYFTANTNGAISVAPTSFQIPLTSTAGFYVGQSVTGTGISSGSVITAISGNNIYVNTATMQYSYASAATISTLPTTIILNGSQYVIIEGGSKANLSIENPNINANTISFQNGASNNKILNCTVKGVSTTNSYATILVGSASQTSSNNNNLIDNCDICDGATKPLTGVSFFGASGVVNTGNTVSNCNIYNVDNATSSPTSIYWGNAYSTSTTIDNNRIYWTNDLTNPVHYVGIWAQGESNTITNNVIGYKANNGTGTLKITSTGNARFTGIRKESIASSNVTLVENNIISNVTLETNYAVPQYNYESCLSGILSTNVATGSENFKVIGNTITNLKVYAAATQAYGTTLTGINIQNVNSEVTNNTVDNLIAVGGTEAVVADKYTTIRGIQIYQQTASSSLVSGNTVSNVIGGEATTVTGACDVKGIFAGANTCSSIEKNKIFNISALNNAGTANTYGLVVFNNSTSTTPTYVKNNIIRLGTDNAVGNNTHAVFQQESSTGSGYKMYFYNNTVYVGGTIALGTTGNTYAINRAISASNKQAEFKNNIFVNVRTGGATGKHYAIKLFDATDYSSSYLASNNNLFQIGSGANNIFGLVNATDIPDFTTWKSTCTGFEAASYNSDPQFNGATALTPDLTINPNLVSDADAKGADLSANVTHDFAGTLRSSKTPYDIGAYGYISNQISAELNVDDLTLTPSSDIQVKAGGHLTINQTTPVSSITVAPGAKLTLGSGTLTTINGITLQSDETGTATIIGSGTYSGTLNANQYLGTTRNWYVSSPVLTSASSSTNIARYYEYIEAGNNNPAGQPINSTAYWKGYNPGHTMVAGKGYIALPSDAGAAISFSGTMNTGEISIALSKSGNGFNLIGNPYPSHLTWTKAFVDAITAPNGGTAPATLIDPTIWYRTNTGSVNSGGDAAWSYKTINASTNEASPLGTSNIIPPMQAFWVKAKVAGNLILTSALTKSHQSSNLLKAPSVKNNERQRVRLEVSNGTRTDETLIYFDAVASNTFDRYDSPKYAEANSVTQIFCKVGNEKLVINGLNAIVMDTLINIGFIPGNFSSFSIKANELTNIPAGVKVILKDNITLIETDLSDGMTAYQFTPEVSTSDRFSLLFRAPGVTTGVNTTEKLNAQVFVNAANQITIFAPEKSNYAIYNAVGQLSAEGTINHSPFTINHSKGVYVVKVNNQSTRVIVK